MNVSAEFSYLELVTVVDGSTFTETYSGDLLPTS